MKWFWLPFVCAVQASSGGPGCWTASCPLAAEGDNGSGTTEQSVERVVHDLIVPALQGHGIPPSKGPMSGMTPGLSGSLGGLRFVTVDQARLQGPDPLEQERFRIATPGGGVVTTRVERLNLRTSGARTIRGRIEGSKLGHFLMSIQEGRCLGEMVIPEKEMHRKFVFSAEAGLHYVVEAATLPDAPLECSETLAPPVRFASKASVSEAEPEPAGRGPDDRAVIDVMVVYTPAARTWAERLGGIDLVIGQAMGRSEMVMENSATGIWLRLVHAAEVAYVESGDSGTDLRRLTHTRGHVSDPEGAMDEVHLLRDTYGADLVMLLALVEDVGGRAWTLPTDAGLPAYGFSLVRVQQAAATYTAVHEIGHNLGAHHHRDQNAQPGPNWPLNSYSSGWRWVGSDGAGYCSVMTYESGSFFADGRTHSRIPLFSNPNLLHAGVPAGDAATADNARTLRETKHAVAGYRKGVVPAYTISGRVSMPDGTGLGAVWIEGLPGFSTTDEAGQYVSALPDGWSGAAVPRRPGYLFHPSGRVYARVGDDLLAQDYLAQACGVGDAVDATHLAFTTGGHGEWHCQDEVTYDGSDAARSGPIADNQESWIETSVVGPGRVEFMWKVSSEANFDFLECYLNGERLDRRISGEVDWELRQLEVGMGTHTLRWRYAKDSSIARGEDAGWLDQVRFTATPATVVARHVFYNHSAWDGFDAAANAMDDMAIAIDKAALLPGSTATFANYTSYSKGLNGIMVDIAGLPASPDIGDFLFKSGNDSTPATWDPAPEPLEISVRPGAGVDGSDRVTLIWRDNDLNGLVEANEAVARQWLQVTVKAGGTTGLAGDDVFYFGNAPGEVGNNPADAMVDTTDVLASFNGQTVANGASVTSNLDFNRDRVVDTTDVLLAFNHQTGLGTALLMLDLGPGEVLVRSLIGKGMEDPERVAQRPNQEGAPGDALKPEVPAGGLRVQRVGDFLEIEAPAEGNVWRLESSTRWNPDGWSAVPVIPELEGGVWRWRVAVVPDDAARFFRVVGWEPR